MTWAYALVCLMILFCPGCSGNSTLRDLKVAIESRDPGTALRAFHDVIYNPSADMSEALPVIRSYLQHPDPWVRYLAGKTLFTAGDDFGLAALVELMRSPDLLPEPLKGSKEDLRMQAARVIGTFRQTAAVDSAIDLYRRTAGSGLLGVLAKLGAEDELMQVMRKHGYVQSQYSVARYGILCPTEFVTKIESTFNSTEDQELKNAAAFALARRKGEEKYISYLVEVAEPAIDGRQRANGFNDNTEALRYLGSVTHPMARDALERALASSNKFAVEIAVVNLLFNQGGSEKARQVILHQLKGIPLRMESWERTLQIAAKLDDPEMRAAGEAFDRQSSGGSWRLWGQQRKNWPIYNWVDDYVVELKPR